MQSLTGRCDRRLCGDFPYVVCYVLEGDRVEVVAVFHGHRNPTAWKMRHDGIGADPNDDT